MKLLQRAFPLLFALASNAGCSSEETASVHQRIVSTSLVISQVYGGGGNSNAPYKNDFIEIFNLGTSPIQLQGYSLQYASATGDFQSNTNVYDLPMFSLQPGQYFLVAGASGGNVGNALPSPDGSTSINMSATAGKVALVLSNQKLNACGGNDGGCQNNWVDLIGYGSTATQYEGSGAAAAPSNTTADLRANGGCTDTDDNKSDFAAGSPTPRNSSSQTNDCSGDGGSDSGASDGGGSSDSGSDADADPDAAQDAGSDADPDAASDSGADAGPVTLGKLVISQVYGGGGNSMATYTNDYVEIFNRDQMPLSTNGYAIQYASPTGTFSNTANTLDLPAVTLAPGQYFLVQLASGGANGMALPTPDATGGLNLGATNGKVALVLSSNKLDGCGTMAMPCMSSDWIDLVGFGTAEQYEGAGAAPAASNTKALFRAGDGCIDTDSNTADFAANNPAPRNTTSPKNTCAPPDGGTSTDAGSDSGTQMDSGAQDASKADATVSKDGSTADGGDNGMGESGGCSCSQASSADGASSVLGGLAALAILSRNRRKRR